MNDYESPRLSPGRHRLHGFFDIDAAAVAVCMRELVEVGVVLLLSDLVVDQASRISYVVFL